ncbi:MAG: DNA replication/repair protein RecF [Firmicutes bacterium]|nr:DNA replication/repair protein RecF [Bacillota bacterium]HAL63660.1 DNA replication/repair protein RecF [Clostridiales bacterium]
MKIKKLTVLNFRNYSQEEILFGENTNIIFGDNAQGKTNLLEAVYLFSHGRSHRTKSDTEMIKFGSEFMKLYLEFSDENRSYKASLQLTKSGKKAININNVPITKLSMLMSYLNVVMFSPEDLQIIKGAPLVRRHFLDEAISQLYPVYLKRLISYHKNLAQKNNLLKKMRYSQKTSDDMLDVWNEQLSSDGSFIMKYRSDFVKRLNEFSSEIHREICGENLNLLYTPSVDCDIIDKDNFYRKLSAVSQREIENGSSLYGIQRDDLRFFIGDREIKNFASQGQQRTAVLSLKMAQMELICEIRGEYPVLLLDDIMSELDASRRAYLSGKIKDKQVILTCTDLESANVGKTSSVFEVKSGCVKKAED